MKKKEQKSTSVKFTSIHDVILFLKVHKWHVVLLLLLLLFLFLRFWGIEEKNQFGWDQADNAWAAKRIIVDQDFPLVGMQAKLNSGVYIGPLYYYFVAIFYFFSGLDPFASGIIAGVTAVFSFFILYFITKDVFSREVAIGAVFIYTVSQYATNFDRVQWPVNFIMPLSLIIFYALYKVVSGQEKYILLLALSIGLFVHVHFTVLFFFLIVLGCLPFFPRTKKTLSFSLASFLLFLLLISPVLYAQTTAAASSHSLQQMIHDYYHGVHLTRILQLMGDAFIKFDSILGAEYLRVVKVFIVPLFIGIYLYKNVTRDRLLLSLLILFWFGVPWFIFSTYRGEISDYYFSSTLPFVYIILSYLSLRVIALKNYALTAMVVLVWVSYSYTNISTFFTSSEYGTIKYRKERVTEAVKNNEIISLDRKVPESYIFYLHLKNTDNTTLINKFY
jgi:4-amino-4-deoxy-L-arabinose transferase-like glycosyltransferase